MSHAAIETHSVPEPHHWRLWPSRHPRAFLVAAASLWFLVYKTLAPLSTWLVGLLPLTPKSHPADAVEFFLYDTPKVLLLLLGVVMVMGMLNSYFTAERTRALLAGKAEGLGNIMAASLSLPELIILRKVLKVRLIAIFVSIVGTGILLVGYVFNAVL